MLIYSVLFVVMHAQCINNALFNAAPNVYLILLYSYCSDVEWRHDDKRLSYQMEISSNLS